MKVKDLIRKLMYCPQEANVWVSAWNGQIKIMRPVEDMCINEDENLITLFEGGYKNEQYIDEYIKNKIQGE